MPVTGHTPDFPDVSHGPTENMRKTKVWCF